MSRLLDAAGGPRGDLLEQPAVALGVVEAGVRRVGASLGVVPGGAALVPDVEAAAEAAAGVVEDLAHVGAPSDQGVTGDVDVVDGQEQAVERAGERGGDPGAEA